MPAPRPALAVEWLAVVDAYLDATLARRDARRYAGRFADTLAAHADADGLASPTRVVLAAHMGTTHRTATRWSGWFADRRLVEVIADASDGAPVVYRLTRPS